MEPSEAVTLPLGRGPLGSVFIEAHPRRVQAFLDEVAVLDTEDAVLVHRAGHVLSYAFPADLVAAAGLPSTAVAEAPGFVTVPWDAVDRWSEEGRRLRHYPPNPYHRVDCRPTRRRLRVTIGDPDAAQVVLVDTDDTVIVFETGLAPVLYVDPRLVRTDLLEPAARRSYCNYKGDATYWSARLGDGLVEEVAWSYADPLPESSLLAGLLAFDLTRCTVNAALPVANGTKFGRDVRDISR
jgi:uncharacterized protein (DUF427 family)